MNGHNDEKLRELLSKAIGPVADAELKRDLWPLMLQKLSAPVIRVPWFDWALIGLLVVLFFLFPEVIPVLAFHL